MSDDMRDSHKAMRHRRRHSIFTGLLIIIVGLALLGERMGYHTFHGVFHQWPLLLIALGASKLWGRPLSLGAQAVLFTGIVFELRHLGYGLSWHPWWPLLIIWIGIMLTLRALRPASDTRECSHD